MEQRKLSGLVKFPVVGLIRNEWMGKDFLKTWIKHGCRIAQMSSDGGDLSRKLPISRNEDHLVSWLLDKIGQKRYSNIK
jgi:hypothetical protein